MRVIFVALGCEQLAVSQLAAIVRRAGHQVGLAFSRHLFDDRLFLRVPSLARLVADHDDADLLDQVRRFNPDVVCYSALTVTYRWMAEVARKVKDLTGAVNVFGGVHPSAVPDVVLEESSIDYVCVGEGDVALPYLLDRLRQGQRGGPLPNMVSRSPNGELIRGSMLPFVQDLDSLPPFEKELWVDHVPLDRFHLTMSARGCPYRCTYCFNNFFANLPGPKAVAGRYVRQRSVDHFLAELVAAKRRFRVRSVDIEDDIFTLDTPWLQEFARRYRKEVGVPFRCFSHANFLDEERVEALREAGCAWVQIGVESASDEYKKTIRRVERRHQIEKALMLLERARIEVKLDHIFGLPGEPDDAQDLALRLYQDHEVGRVGTFWLCYMPGTEITQAGLRAGVLTPAEADAINRGECTFFYRDSAMKTPGQREMYLAYEAAFRALPLLPKSLKRRLDPKRLMVLPSGLVRKLGVVADTLAGIRRGNPELPMYLAQYSLGIQNHFRRRLGMEPKRRFGRGDTDSLEDPVWRDGYARAIATLEDATLGTVKAGLRDVLPVADAADTAIAAF